MIDATIRNGDPLVLTGVEGGARAVRELIVSRATLAWWEIVS